MADPLSFAAGVAGLSAFALESSKVLYNTVERIRSHGKSVRELKEETASLRGVLTSLDETMTICDVDFTALRTPLLRCGRLCQECSIMVTRCTSRAGEGNFSIRDFLALTYNGKGITELLSLISAYKSTITIALADANLRQVTVTTKLLQEYQRTIEETREDLDELLQRYGDLSAATKVNGQDELKLHEAPTFTDAEERTSIEECLKICTTMSEHIEEVQKELAINYGGRPQRHSNLVELNAIQARQITSQRLQSCKSEFGLTSNELRLRLRDIDLQLAKLSTTTPLVASAGEKGSVTSAQEELRSIRQCLSICQEATELASGDRINLFEDIKMADDGQQIIVSTMGDLICARRITAGQGSLQVFGQMSDVSLQQFAKADAHSHGVESAEVPGSHGDEVTAKTRPRAQFTGRYGAGQRLDT